MGTLYDVLGVRRDSTADEIKQAYHQLALDYHPDKNPSQTAVEKMKEINEAYRVLGDEKLRAEYDAKAFRPAGDSLYARWYRPRPGSFGHSPGTTDSNQAEPPLRPGGFGHSPGTTDSNQAEPPRTIDDESVDVISREQPVMAAIVGLALGIIIIAIFFLLDVHALQAKYGVVAPVAFDAAAAFLPPFVFVLLQRNELNNRSEAGLCGSIILIFALTFTYLYMGPPVDLGWCMNCCALPALCVIAGWLIGRFVGLGTWDLIRD